MDLPFEHLYLIISKLNFIIQILLSLGDIDELLFEALYFLVFLLFHLLLLLLRLLELQLVLLEEEFYLGELALHLGQLVRKSRARFGRTVQKVAILLVALPIPLIPVLLPLRVLLETPSQLFVGLVEVMNDLL